MESEESASSIGDDMGSGQSFSSNEMDSFPPVKKLKLNSNSEITDSSDDSDEDNDEEISEGSFKNEVNAVLRKVNKQAAGEFAVSGELKDAPLITISIKNAGNGKIFFPFYEENADGIIQSFEQSPYGKGSQTVVDTDVRNSWELAPGGFEILNRKWSLYINDVLLPRIRNEMVISSPFTASLYKLLLYKTGSFFKPHRDSEKEDGMFATLVIQLPTKYQGGQLVVNHDGKTKTMDFSSSDTDTNEFSTFYSAFYCDCQHEILPVTEGLRLCLIYNLVSQKNIILLPQRNPFEKKLKPLLENWGSPGKLVYGLKHKYSTHNISFANLKTTDRAVASMLKYLSEEHVPLDIYLAVFEKEYQGNGEEEDCYSDDGSSTQYDLRNLISLTGDEKLPMKKLTVDFKDEVIPENCFKHIEPYHTTEEPMGNEGMDCSRSYRSSAIVFWPKKYLLRALKSSGVSNSEVMDTFQKGVQEYRKKPTEQIRKKVLEDAKALVYGESTKDCYYGSRDKDEKNYWNRLLDSLIELKDLELIQSLCDRSLIMNREILPKIIEQCEHFGWKPFAKPLVSMFQRAGGDHKEAAELLDSMIGKKMISEERKEIFRSVMSAILEKYKDQRSRYPTYYGEPSSKIQNENAQFIFRLAQKIDFNMVELLKLLLKKIVLNEAIIPWIVSECNKYGWKSFKAEIPIMVEKLSEFDATDLLEMIIGKDVDDDQKEIGGKIVSAVLEKIRKASYDDSIQRNRRQKKEEKLLDSLCSSAVKINFNMIEVLQTLLPWLNILNQTSFPWVVNQCNIYGWKHFVTQFPAMFQKISSISQAVNFLNLLIGKNAILMDDDKKQVCSSVLTVVLDKIKKGDPSTPEQLYSLCIAANKIDLSVIEFMKTRPFTVAVPLLVKLSQSITQEKILKGQWGTIINHFIQEMRSLIDKKNEVPNWKINNPPSSCPCNDCSALQTFLKKDLQTQQFKMGKDRRNHLGDRVNRIPGIVHETNTSLPGTGVLIVKKTVKSGLDNFDKGNCAAELLPKLLKIVSK